MNQEDRFLRTVQLSLVSISAMVALLVLMTVVIINPAIVRFIQIDGADKTSNKIPIKQSASWSPPDSVKIPMTDDGDLIRYGQELVSKTSMYLGPRGSVVHVTNGMNCQNCHLKAGKKPFGNNYSAVASTYPKFRARSGSIESIEKRVNDCIERSLNGQRLDEGSREMQGFVAYIRWLGKDVQPGVTPEGAGIFNLPLLERAASPLAGKKVYQRDCQRCHGENGEGIRINEFAWRYPPVWGEESFNAGAGLFRLSRMAGYVKMNMPQDISGDKPLLTVEEAWDVSAFINSMPRPRGDFSRDWPDISTKPFDHPFGPFTDKFPAEQHKYGPFEPIKFGEKK